MGARKYPPLTPSEIESILLARGFTLTKNEGDHSYYSRKVQGKPCIVQIDNGNPLITDKWLKLTITQSGMTREQFYCSTKTTAKKIGETRASKDDLLGWADEKKKGFPFANISKTS